MTLYLKYRPQKIDELDLEKVRESLKKIVASDNIPHAFLFSGSKGAGKTSAARILAKIVNCENLKKTKNGIEPCNKCDSCVAINSGATLDVIEMDAASHRGIDDIRSLNESVMLAPSNLTKKVYILDEAHMLTMEAANAFLKTLEEPPSHAIFILATTNPEKLPATIRSRTFNVVFEKATKEEVTRQINRVIKGEGIKLEDGIIDLIYKASDGSFRDAIKILEQISSDLKEIKLIDAQKLISEINTSDTYRLFEYLKNKDGKSAIELVEKVSKSSSNIKGYLDEILANLHSVLLSKTTTAENKSEIDFSIDEIITLTNLFIKAKSQISLSYISQLPIELAIVKWCDLKNSKTQIPNTKTERKEKKIEKLDSALWNEALLKIRAKNVSIETLLRTAEVIGFDEGKLKIGVYYRFHKEKLETVSNKKILEDALSQITNTPINVLCELVERKPLDDPKPQETLTQTSEPDIIDAAKDIFNHV